MAYTDKQLTCTECSNQFVFTAGEQEFYASRGLTNEPRRCPTCRQARKASGQGDSRGGGYGGGSGRPRAMYAAVCANCGVETQVPFKPTGIRPVYCSDCFSKVRQ